LHADLFSLGAVPDGPSVLSHEENTIPMITGMVDDKSPPKSGLLPGRSVLDA
jgi:hypothetical protein